MTISRKKSKFFAAGIIIIALFLTVAMIGVFGMLPSRTVLADTPIPGTPGSYFYQPHITHLVEDNEGYLTITTDNLGIVYERHHGVVHENRLVFDHGRWATFRIEFESVPANPVIRIDVGAANRRVAILSGDTYIRPYGSLPSGTWRDVWNYFWTDLTYMGISRNPLFHGADYLQGNYHWFDISDFVCDTNLSFYLVFGSYHTGHGASVGSISVWADGEIPGEYDINARTVTVTGNSPRIGVGNTMDNPNVYMWYGTEVRSAAGGYRFADGNFWWTMRVQFTDPGNTPAMRAYLVGGNRWVGVLPGGSYTIPRAFEGDPRRDRWTPISYVGIQRNPRLNGADYFDGQFSYFDLSEWVLPENDNVVYLAFGANNVGQGHGTRLNDIFFMSDYNIPEAVDTTVVVDRPDVFVDASHIRNIYQLSGTQVNFYGDRFADHSSWFVLRALFPGDPNTQNLLDVHPNPAIRVHMTGHNRMLMVNSSWASPPPGHRDAGWANFNGWTPLSYQGINRMGRNNALDGADFFCGQFTYFDVREWATPSEDGDGWSIYVSFMARRTQYGHGARVEFLHFMQDFVMPNADLGTSGAITGGHINEFAPGQLHLNIPVLDNSLVRAQTAGAEVRRQTAAHGAGAWYSAGAGRFAENPLSGIRQEFTYAVKVPAGAQFLHSRFVASGRKRVEVSNDNGANWSPITHPGLAIGGGIGPIANNGAFIREIAGGTGTGDHARALYYVHLDRFLNADGPTQLLMRFGGDTALPTQNRLIYLFSLDFWYGKSFDTPLDLPANYVVNTQTVLTGGPSEREFILERAGGGFNPTVGTAFFNGSHSVTYQFDINPNATGNLLLTDVRAGFRISVSTDSYNFVDVAMAPVTFARSAAVDNVGLKQFNITSIVDGADRLYVRFAAAMTDGNFGSQLSYLEVLCIIPVTAGTATSNTLFAEGRLANRIPLWGTGLLHADNGSTFNFGGRSITRENHFTYRFVLPNDATTFFISTSIVTANNLDNLAVSVSNNGTDFEPAPAPADTARTSSQSNSTVNSSLSFDLSAFARTSRTVYVRFGHSRQTHPAAAPITLARLYTAFNRESLSAPGIPMSAFDRIEFSTFLTGTPMETEFIHRMSAGDIMGARGQHPVGGISWLNRNEMWPNVDDGNTLTLLDGGRLLNKDSYVIYRFVYAEWATQVNLVGNLGNTFMLSVSTNGTAFTDVLVSDRQFLHQWFAIGAGATPLANSAAEVNIDISAFMYNNPNRTIYVKISNPITDLPSGANFRGLGIVSLGELDESRIPQPPGNDYENGGCGCGSSNVGAVAIVFMTLTMFAALVVGVRKKR